MPERLHLDFCGNRIEVGDWVLTHSNRHHGTMEIGVVTKLCASAVAISTKISDERSINWGKDSGIVHREPRFVCCFQKTRLPDYETLRVQI